MVSTVIPNSRHKIYLREKILICRINFSFTVPVLPFSSLLLKSFFKTKVRDMKNYYLGVFFVASAMTASVANAASVSGGTIKFTGTVVNAACAVSAESSELVVNMGQVRSAAFTAVGTESSRTPFNIKLTDCDTTVSKNASVTFTGVANTTTPAFEAGIGAGKSIGMGLKIYDATGKGIIPNTGNSIAHTLIPGSNTIPFNVSYISLIQKVSAGDASANIDFVMNYL